MSATEEQRLRQWFNAIDVNRDGTLDAAELMRALAQAGLQMPENVCALLLRMHDMDRSGTIDFQEFVSIHNFVSSVTSSFMQVDRDRNGVLTLPEINEALRTNNFFLGENALHAVCASFDHMKRGFLGMAEYVGLAAFLSTGRHLFAHYDPRHTGQVHLNFDAFCWILGIMR
mmetsp:Transcript_5154/g.15427  ORF Transcript_5154/g.15427 Transcript_5154/m.15427 type:complete len:172 (+) Transcript_5154:233-748(+)